MTSKRTQKKIAEMPDEIEFIDEDGNLLEEFGVVELTPELKLALAELSIKWHQSIEKTFLRMVMSGVKTMVKTMEKKDSNGD